MYITSTRFVQEKCAEGPFFGTQFAFALDSAENKAHTDEHGKYNC
jgi:hypothetical protein